MKHINILFIVLIIVVTAIAAKAQNNSASEIEIKGVVYNAASKQPIEAATVSCGSFSSGFTNSEGQFSLKVRSFNDIITITTDGFHAQDVPVSGQTELEVYMLDNTAVSMQEYAYDAFSKKKKIYTTQSVATVSSVNQSNASRMNIGSAEAVFDGRIAGLDVHSRNGLKGIGSNLFLRGFSSLYCNNQPLVIVDGMIYDINNYGNSLIKGHYSNPLEGISVEDIENVTLIRDAASIYGSKASNGVIFIRTGHTVKQATSIELSVSGNLELAPNNIPMLNSEDYRTYLNQIMIQKLGLEAVSDMPFLNNDLNFNDYYKYHNNTDWQNKVSEDSYSTNYNLRIKGGDDVALYSITVGFIQQDGTVKNSNNSRFNLRFNSDIKFSPKVTLNSNIAFYYSKKDLTGSGVESYYDPVYLSRIKAPFIQEYMQDEQGIAKPNLSDYDFLNLSNPSALINNMIQQDATYRLFGSFNFNWKINENLTLSDLVGVSFDKDRQRIFIPSQGVVPDSVDYGIVTNQMKTRILRNFAINNDFRLNYKKDIDYNNKIDIQAGARLNVNNIEEDWGGDFNSANDQMQSLGNGNYLLRTKGGFIGEWSSLTFYANADYALKNRYLVTASFSLDGSSRFGDNVSGINLFDTPFKPYYGIAGAWIASSENFMANVSVINLLKLRTSFGITGNDDIGNYTSKKYYTSETFLGYQGTVLGALWNPALGPEKTTKLNFGIDFSVFTERLLLSVDIYNNKTTDLFDFMPVSSYSGFNGYYGNNGGFTTKGIDFSLNARMINKNLFKWDFGMVLSKYNTIVNEIYGERRYETFYTANILTQVGSPIAQFFGYKTNGVYASSEDAINAGLLNRMDNEDLIPFSGGDMIFEDYNTDGIIDENDLQVIGDPTPDFYGEIYSKLRYKKITLDASLAFSYGNEAFNYLRYTLENMKSTNNQTQAVINRWSYQGQVTTIPKVVTGDPMNNSRFSDRWIEDASYARLKNITLSYMIPFNTKIVKYAEVYATGVNLFTFTKYKGVDPEFSINGAALMQGIDIGMVPQNKMLLIGVKIGL